MIETDKYQSILEENLKLHKSESKYYEIQHEEIFNIFEQWRIKRKLKSLQCRLDHTSPALDLGCGTGNLTRHLTSFGLKVISSDLSMDMLREISFPVNKVLCDSYCLPFKTNSFKLITTYSFFHHLPDVEKSLREICRVAMKSSLLYFDHDPFGKNGEYSYSKFFRLLLKGFRLFGLLLWILTKPKYFLRLFKYLLKDRKRHLKRLKDINLELTERAAIDFDKFLEILEENNFKVKISKYKRGTSITAERV